MLSVVAAGVTGLVYLIPILFVLPDVDALLNVTSGQPIGLIFKHATGSAGGGFGLLFLILGIWFFAGIGALTASSRCTYAFARDGAIPWSKYWSRIDKRFDMPILALTLSAVIDALLGLIYFGSEAAFNSFTGVATISLSASYAFPILVSLINRRRKVLGARFSLGRMGFFVNTVTICWIVLAVFLLSMPTSLKDLDESSMNYASVVFAGFAAISFLWYLLWGHKHFQGPPILLTDVPSLAIGVHKDGLDDVEKAEYREKQETTVTDFRQDEWQS